MKQRDVCEPNTSTVGQRVAFGLAPYLTELLGTYLLVVTFGCAVLGAQAEIGPTTVAFALTILTYACWHVSGAHLNPAVTLALVLSRRESLRVAAGFVVMQAVGGALGGLTFSAVFNAEFDLGPKPRFGWSEVAAAETLYTAVVCFVVLCCVPLRTAGRNGDENQFFGLAVGFSFVMAGYSVGNISGACLNPAVSLGVFWCGTGWAGGGALGIYVACQLFGAAVAALIFRCLVSEELVINGEPEPLLESNLHVRVGAEFLGTFVVTLTAGLNLKGASPVGPWSVGAALMCMTYSLGGVSGGHFNPAVTAALVCSHEGLSANEGRAYLGSQLLAGILGAMASSALHVGAPMGLQPDMSRSWFGICYLEGIFTMIVALVVLSVKNAGARELEDSPSRRRFHVGLAYGFAAAAGGFAAKQVTGGVLNPSITMGFCAVDSLSPGNRYIHMFFYACSQLLGGVCAALVFVFTRPPPRSVDGPETAGAFLRGT